MYVITCGCGNEMDVTAAMAGTSTTCVRCHKTIGIPSLSRLKSGAGEFVSGASPADLIALAIESRSPPFDGMCQVCTESPAALVLPVYLAFKERRETTGEDFGYTSSDEQWRSVSIPCMFCYSCEKRFDQEWRSSKIRKMVAVSLLLLVIPVAALMLLLFSMFICFSLPGLIFIVFLVLRFQSKKQGDRFLIAHLSQLRYVPKLLAEDEYILEWQPMRAITQG
jgi:hypothetical protein